MSTNMTTGEFSYTAGLDIGNGYVKGVIEDRAPGTKGAVPTDVIDIPSAKATLTRPNDVTVADDLAPETVADGASWFNEVDLSFSSALVPDTFRRLIGRRALSSKVEIPVTSFDLLGNTSKADQYLSKVLVLGLIAAKAARDYITANGRVPSVAVAGPSSLTARVKLGLALPIDEYRSRSDAYSAAFVGISGEQRVHQVRLNNFATPITVSILVEKVVVVPEGASAQFAINHHGEPLMNALLADVRSKGVALEGIEAKDLLAATDTVGVDVGEGTVNFPVFTNGKFNTDASATFNAGFGTVLENTIATMSATEDNAAFANRKALAEYLQTPVNNLKIGFRKSVEAHVDQNARFFVEEVALALSRVLRVVGAQTQVIYVYGGGSGPLREHLHTALLEKTIEINGSNAAPVMYLDSSYSRGLNREGLLIAARKAVVS